MSHRIIYNITFQLEQDTVDLWRTIVQKEVIPEITDGKIILSTQISRIDSKQSGVPDSYALQFLFHSEEDFKEHRLSKMAVLLEKIDEKMRGRYVYFATKMEVVHYYYKNTD